MKIIKIIKKYRINKYNNNLLCIKNILSTKKSTDSIYRKIDKDFIQMGIAMKTWLMSLQLLQITRQTFKSQTNQI